MSEKHETQRLNTMALGLSLGLVLGIVMGNIVLGLCLGLVFDFALGRRNKQDQA
jgi:hypothetical protein